MSSVSLKRHSEAFGRIFDDALGSSPSLAGLREFQARRSNFAFSFAAHFLAIALLICLD